MVAVVKPSVQRAGIHSALQAVVAVKQMAVLAAEAEHKSLEQIFLLGVQHDLSRDSVIAG